VVLSLDDMEGNFAALPQPGVGSDARKQDALAVAARLEECDHGRWLRQWCADCAAEIA
jgi:hypothetical protein